MYLKKWDIELEIIQKESQQLTNNINRTINTHKNIQKINYLKIYLQYLQAEIASKIEKILIYSSKKEQMQNIQKTILHWAGIYAQKIQDFILKKYQNLDKMMWISIIKSKLPGTSSHHKIQIEDEDILVLSIRQANLIETEKKLTEHLMQLKLQKETLHQKYNDLCISIANKAASRSLNITLGRNLEESIANPLFLSFKNLFNLIISPIKLYFTYKQHKHLINNISAKTNSIIKECKNLALNDLQYPRNFNSPSFKNTLYKYLNDIYKLQDDFLDIKSRLNNENIPMAKPKIKKSSIANQFEQKLKLIAKSIGIIFLIYANTAITNKPTHIKINAPAYNHNIKKIIQNNMSKTTNFQQHKKNIQTTSKQHVTSINNTKQFKTNSYAHSNISNYIHPSIQIRSDLYPTFQKILCNNKKIPSPIEILKLGIYDVQISGKVLLFSRTQTHEQNKSLLISLAKQNAIRSEHHGLVFGQCNINTYWYITLPSPEPISKIHTTEGYYIPYNYIKKYCSRLKISFVNAYEGPAKDITPDLKSFADADRITLNPYLLSDGMISVTCYSKSSSNNLSTLWYLIPVKNGPYPKPPFYNFLKKKSQKNQDKIITWINALRKKHNIHKLIENNILNITAKTLSKTNSVNHNKKNLLQVQSFLSPKGFIFQSEERVKAQDLIEATWLLWNSPSHRNGLINSKSTHIGVYYEQKNLETFIIIVLAKYNNKFNKLLSIIHNFISF